MKEYIERDAALKQIEEMHTGEDWMVSQYNADWIYSFLDTLPAADVVERVRGEWIGKPIAGYTTVKCSVCRSAFSANTGRWNFCPNCGADMRGEEK